nr:MAG TPA: hypothetical protein [Caudoviricetes sp.]
MTNQELKTTIKEELKKAGFKKGYTISVKDCLYSTSMKIKINDPTINRKEIEKIAHKFQEIDRDERTGEILSGGNCYVFVEYKEGIFEEVAREYEATAKGAMMSKDVTTKIFDGLYLINWEHSGNLEIRQQNEKDYRTFKVYDLKQLSEFIYKFAKFGTIAA